MGTELTTARPTPTPEVAKSLSPQQLSAHRAAIAFEVKTVLSAYFQPHEADEIKAAQLAWWCDELQDWTQEQVVWALRHWNRESPRIRPTPGDIVAICKAARGRKVAAQRQQQPEEPNVRKPANPDAVREMLASAGFAPKRMGGE